MKRNEFAANDNTEPSAPCPPNSAGNIRQRSTDSYDDIDLANACCLDVLAKIRSRSVHMVLADLPYGTTNCAWDTVIDLQAFWREVERILAPTGAVVMFGSQPFTTVLAASNLPWLKYSLVWEKTRPTGFLQAGQKPLKAHEDILVFSPGTTVHKGRGDRHMTYNPQGLVELVKPRTKPESYQFAGRKMDARKAGAYTQAADRELIDARTSEAIRGTPGAPQFNGKRILGHRKPATHTNYPTSVLRFASERRTVHPTQKPVDLCEYLIRTFSNEGEVVLDPTMGSGTAGVAARRANRFFIGVERDPQIFATAVQRLAAIDLKKAA